MKNKKRINFGNWHFWTSLKNSEQKLLQRNHCVQMDNNDS